MLKQTVTFLTIIATFILWGCTGDETNPFDTEGNNYISPELTIQWDSSVTNVINGGILLEDTLFVSVTGNTLENEFRWKINSDEYTAWTSTPLISYSHLDDGLHKLYIQTRYPEGLDIDTDTISFTVSLLPVKAVYLYPFKTKYNTGESIEVQVNTKGIESAYLMHLELIGATIVKDTLIYEDSSNIKTDPLVNGSVIDIIALGNQSIYGNGGVVSLQLALTDTTGVVNMVAVLKDSLNNTIALDTVRGGYFVEK